MAPKGKDKAKGNLSFVDMFNWLKGIIDDREDMTGEELFDDLVAYVEDEDEPFLCRLALWGVPCDGCDFDHGERTLRLWSTARKSGKVPAWMRTPPFSPALKEMPLGELDALWRSDPDECQWVLAPKIHYVSYQGAVVWGKDLGEESGSCFRAFVETLQEAATKEEAAPDGSSPNQPVSETYVQHMESAFLMSDVWRNTCTFLPIREVAQATAALLSNSAARASIEGVCDWSLFAPQRTEFTEPCSSTCQFLAAARATCFTRRVLSAFPRARRDDALLDSAPSRSFAPGGVVSSVAVSSDLVAFDVDDRQIKLVRRYDLVGCGVLPLRGRGGIECLSLSTDGQALALVPASAGERQAKVHFYNTTEGISDATQEVVSLGGPGCLTDCLEFLPQSSPSTAVAGCGASVFQLSAEPGAVVAKWSRDEGARITMCKAAGPHHAVTLAEDGCVELWDVRLSTGSVGRVCVRDASALAADASAAEPRRSVVGDCAGCLHFVDWRSATVDAYWALGGAIPDGPPPAVRALAFGEGNTLLAAQAFSFDVLLVAGGAPLSLGKAPLRPKELGPAATGPNAWVLAVGQKQKTELWLSEFPGEGPRIRAEQAAPELKKKEKVKVEKVFRKSTGNNTKQSFGAGRRR